MVSASATSTSPLGSTWIQRGCLRPVGERVDLEPGRRDRRLPGGPAPGGRHLERRDAALRLGRRDRRRAAHGRLGGAGLAPPPQDRRGADQRDDAAENARQAHGTPPPGRADASRSRARWGQTAHARIIVGCCPSGPTARLRAGHSRPMPRMPRRTGHATSPLPRSPRACRRTPAPRGSRPWTTTTGKCARPPWRTGQADHQRPADAYAPGQFPDIEVVQIEPALADFGRPGWVEQRVADRPAVELGQQHLELRLGAETVPAHRLGGDLAGRLTLVRVQLVDQRGEHRRVVGGSGSYAQPGRPSR